MAIDTLKLKLEISEEDKIQFKLDLAKDYLSDIQKVISEYEAELARLRGKQWK